MTFHPNSLGNLKGKVFLVTGGNSGIGYYTVSHLAGHGAHVYLGARSSEKGAAAIADIKKQHPAADIDLLLMDHTDLSSVTAAADRVLGAETALHGLINNAGIMATPFAMTRDGHEGQWQTNYLAHWVLTERLLPLLRRTAKSLPPGGVRIVNISSGGHLGAPRDGIHFADPALPGGGVMERYGQSKLANILHVQSLHRTYGPGSASARAGEGEIWAAAVHPGVVETNLLVPTESALLRASLAFFRCLRLTYPADKGAWTSLFCAAGPDMTAQESGGYFDIFRRLFEPWWLSGHAKDEKLALRLDEWTREAMQKWQGR